MGARMRGIRANGWLKGLKGTKANWGQGGKAIGGEGRLKRAKTPKDFLSKNHHQP